jgi:hypothetical protein
VARILPQSEIRTRGTSKQQLPQLELAGKEAELKKLVEAAMEDEEDDVEEEEGEEEEEEEPSRPPSPKLLRFRIILHMSSTPGKERNFQIRISG